MSLTFDDGLQSQLTLAVPLLNSYGLKGTFFLVTKKVASDDQWAEWRAVAADGHEIGSHNVTDSHLTTVSSVELDAEIRESRFRSTLRSKANDVSHWRTPSATPTTGCRRPSRNTPPVRTWHQ